MRVQRDAEVVGPGGVVPGVELLQLLVRQHRRGRHGLVGPGQQCVEQGEVVPGGALPLHLVEAGGVEVEVEHEARRGGGLRAQLPDLEGEPVGGVPGVQELEADRAAEALEDRVLVVEVHVVQAGAGAMPGHVLLVAGRLQEGALRLPGEVAQRGVAAGPHLQREHVHEQAGRVAELGRTVRERRADAQEFPAADAAQVGEERGGERDGGRGVPLPPGELGDAGAAFGVEVQGEPGGTGRARHVVFPAVEDRPLHRLGQRLAPVAFGPGAALGAA